MKKKNFSTIELYDNNIQRLMNISKLIDEDNVYSTETQNDSVFIKLLFQDIRKCSQWYSNEEWKPIKTAIHNCYKLIQKGYVPEIQGELENNIKILEILLKDRSLKKSNVEKISEEVVQDIFDKTIKNLNLSKSNIIIDNKINTNIQKKDEEEKKIDKNEYVTKLDLENALNEQKNFYENKINNMEKEINELKDKVNNMSILLENVGKCFNISNK